MDDNYKDVVKAIRFIANLSDDFTNTQINDHLKSYEKKWENGGPFISAIQSIIDNQNQRIRFGKDVPAHELYAFLKRYGPVKDVDGIMRLLPMKYKEQTVERRMRFGAWELTESLK